MKGQAHKASRVVLAVLLAQSLGGCAKPAEKAAPAPKEKSAYVVPEADHPAPKPAPPVPYGAGGRWVLGPLVGAVVLNGQTGVKGDVVAPSGFVSTAATDGSAAALDLPYDVRVSLGPDSSVVRGEDASVLVLRGAVSVSAPPVGNVSRKETRVVTAWGMVEVLGSGELAVEVLPSGDARLTVRSGRVAAQTWAASEKDATDVLPDKPLLLGARGLTAVAPGAASPKVAPLSAASRKRAAQAGAAALKGALARFQSELLRGRSLANAQRQAVAAHADAQAAARQIDIELAARRLDSDLRRDQNRAQTERERQQEERRNSMAERAKRFGDILKNSLPKMPQDIWQLAAYFDTVENLFRTFDVPAELQTCLLRPF